MLHQPAYPGNHDRLTANEVSFWPDRRCMGQAEIPGEMNDLSHFSGNRTDCSCLRMSVHVCG